MPIYRMPAPDGKTYRIEGPVGATDDQIKAEIIRQNPHLAEPAPTEAPAPAPAPKESVTKPREYEALEVPGEAIVNAPASAWKTAKNFGKLVAGVMMSPAAPLSVTPQVNETDAFRKTSLGQELSTTPTNIAGTITGAGIHAAALPVQAVTGKSHAEAVKSITPEMMDAAVKMASAAGGALADRYGGYENIKRTLAEDPVGAAFDIATLAQGGAGLARKAGATGTADMIAKVGNAPVNALSAAVRYPTNKLADVAGWTFDTLTGQRVPVETGKLARRVVGEENLVATRNALAPRPATPEATPAAPVAPVTAPTQVPPAAAGALPKPTTPDGLPKEGTLMGGELAKREGAAGHYAKDDLDLMNAIDADFTVVGEKAARNRPEPTAPQAIVEGGVNAPRVAALKPGDAAFRVGKAKEQVGDRLAQLQEHTPDITAAVKARAEATAPLWQAGDASVKPISPELSDLITKSITPQQMSILEREAAVQGLDFGRVAPTKDINGRLVYPKVSGQSLYNFKRLLDDIANNPGLTNAAGISANTAKAVLSRYKPALYKHIPEYGEAAKVHAKLSEPINQSVVMKHFTDKLVNSLSDVKEGAAPFAKLTDKLDELPPGVQTVLRKNNVPITGKSAGDLLSKDARDALANVTGELKRDQLMKEMASEGGTKELAKMMGTGKLFDYAPLDVAVNVAIRVINKVGLSVSEASRAKLVEAAKTPGEFLKVIDTLPASERVAVLKAMKDAKIDLKGAAVPAAVGNALAPDSENKNALTK